MFGWAALERGMGGVLRGCAGALVFARFLEVASAAPGPLGDGGAGKFEEDRLAVVATQMARKGGGLGRVTWVWRIAMRCSL